MGQIIAVVRNQPFYLAPKAVVMFLLHRCALFIIVGAMIYPSIVDMGSFLNFYQRSLSQHVNKPVGMTKALSDEERSIVSESFSIDHSYYDFTHIPRAFAHRTSLHYLTQFDQRAVVNNVLKAMPMKLKKRAYRYLPYFFHYSQVYKIDPYWAISIAWTESHFNRRAISWVGARGLMQLMPQTERWLKGEIKEGSSYGNRTVKNIELGIFYLSKLLKQFDGNYREATVAYNMGPGWVRRWKAKRRFVGSRRNVYLNKVKRHYRILSKSHYYFVKGCDTEYAHTYVVKPSKAKLRSYDLSLEREFKMAMAPLISMN